MTMDTRESPKVAIVTGAGHPDGIGAASAEALRNQGYEVITFDLEGADRAVDVTHAQQVTEAIQAVVADFGQLNALVNNAGVGVGSANLLEQSSEDLDLTLAVNVKGVVHCCQAAIPQLLKNDGGAIVNVASLCGLRALPAIPHAYTASKFAVVGLPNRWRWNLDQATFALTRSAPARLTLKCAQRPSHYLQSRKGFLWKTPSR